MSFSGRGPGRSPPVPGGWSGAELLARPVRLRGIPLGKPVDLLVDTDAMRLIGFDVRCGDDVVRFLPLAATRVRPDELEVRSALLLLDGGDTSFYRRRTQPLRDLRGLAVGRDGDGQGRLADVEVVEDGEVVALLLDDGRRVAASELTRSDGRASAA